MANDGGGDRLARGLGEGASVQNPHGVEAEGLVGGEVVAAVREILAEVDGDVAGRRPVCRASGRCCKFEAYGHRLYVTGVELMYFAAREGRASPVALSEKKSVSLPQFFGAEKIEGCPYQVGGLCTAREGRPLGCRIYFCDENAQGWQNEVYEKYHAKLRGVHEKFGVPYRYVEWRAGLRELMEEGRV
ncbi:MAG: hypothetical protein ACTHN5_16025 [Phycisphaerae bacterium]